MLTAHGWRATGAPDHTHMLPAHSNSMAVAAARQPPPLRRQCRAAQRLVCAAASPPPDGALSPHHDYLRRQRVLPNEPQPPRGVRGGDVLELNVGGKVMATARSTLTQVAGSRLAAMFSGSAAAEARLARDAVGRVFLDWDPAAFGLVLRYLREVKLAGGDAASVPLPPARREDEAAFRQLCAFLQLPGAAGEEEEGLAASPEAEDFERLGEAVALPAAAAGAGRAQGRNNSVPFSSDGDGHSRGGSSSSGGRSQQQHQQQHQHQQGFLKLKRPQAPRGSGADPNGTLSQLFYIQAHQEAAPPSQQQRSSQQGASGSGSSSGSSSSSGSGGVRVSVYTEGDLASGAANARDAFDVVVDATHSKQRLVFSLVTRRDFDDCFVGVTSRTQVEQRGLTIPCFGWKRIGCRYGPAGGAGGAGGAAGSGDDGGAIRQGNSGGGGSRQQRQRQQSTAAATTAAPLWRKGDNVELILELSGQQRPGSQAGGNRLLLKVNGAQVDALTGLPGFKQWCCYLALYQGSDAACVVFDQRAYSVYVADYRVTRYL